MEEIILQLSVRIPLAEAAHAHVGLRPDADSLRRMEERGIMMHHADGITHFFTATPSVAPVFLRFFGDLSAEQQALSAHTTDGGKAVLIAIEVDAMGRLSRDTKIIEGDARFDQRVQVTLQVAPKPTGLPIVQCDVPPLLVRWMYLFVGPSSPEVDVEDAAGLVGFSPARIPADLTGRVHAAWHSDKVLSVADHFGVRAQAVQADGTIIDLPRPSPGHVVKDAQTGDYITRIIVNL